MSAYAIMFYAYNPTASLARLLANGFTRNVLNIRNSNFPEIGSSTAKPIGF